MPSPQAASGEHFALSQHKGHVRVTLAGTPDLLAVQALHAALAGLVDSGKDIVLDCAAVEHISSAALQVLIAVQAALAQRRRLRIESESAAIRDYLRIAGLDGLFPAGPDGTARKRKRSSQVSPQP